MASAPSDTFSAASQTQTGGPGGSEPTGARGGGERLVERAAEAAAGVKERVRNLAGDEVVDRAADAVLELKDQVRDAADQQLHRGAAGIESVARAVHGAAKDFEQTLPQAAGLIHHAADQIERASTTMRNSSVEDIVTLVDDFARRQPVAFFGGAVLAGFVFSRFLKSSAEYRSAADTERMADDRDFPPRRNSLAGV